MALNWTANKGDRSRLFGTLDISLCAQHMTLQELLLLGYLSEQNVDEAFTFAVCRNPWDRVLSSYRHFVGESPKSKQELEQFIRTWYESPSRDHNVLAHKRRQIDYVRSLDGKVRLNHLIRYESLDDGFAELLNKANLPRVKLPHIGMAQASENAYQSIYSKAARAMVHKRFAEDIEFFGYKF